MTCGELRRHGDLGLGKFNALDGRMIAFDRGFYQVKTDGVAYPKATRWTGPSGESESDSLLSGIRHVLSHQRKHHRSGPGEFAG